MVKFALYNIESKGKPVVGETGMATAIDEDVLLCNVFSGEQRDSWLHVLTGLRRLWMIRIEWRYSNPWEASASLGMFLGCEHCTKDRHSTYQMKAVDSGALRCEIHNVSVNHPFSDDMW